MGIPEAVEDDGTEPLGPEPPPAGSADYRRVILNICAADTLTEYDDRMAPVWQWRGWRAGVEVMVELMGALAVNAPPEMKDAFGGIRVDGHVVVMDDDEMLRTAARSAANTYPELPRHEALARSLADGEELRDMQRSLIPAWNQAATLLQDATDLNAMEPARVVFTRWLNDHYRDRRVWAANMAAATTHTHWRFRVMPPGNGWVEDFVMGGPDLTGSYRWAATASLEDVRRAQQALVDGWVSQARTPVGVKAKGARKARARCCPGCGKKKR